MTDEHKQWEKEVSQEFGASMNDIRTQPVPDESLLRSLKAAEAISMTKAAWKRGFTNAAFAACFVYSVIGAITFAICKLLDVNMFVAMGLAFAAFWVVVFAIFVCQWIWSAHTAGGVLLDCGPHPGRFLFVAHAVVGLAVGVILFAYSFGGEWQIHGFAAIAFSYAFFWGIASTGRLQIREHGIWQYWSLLRWEKIDSYRWEGTTDATLMIQVKTRFAFLGRGALPVAVEQKEAVDELLQQHVDR